MKILVTGSSGLVGSAIKKESINSDHDFFFLCGQNRIDLRDPTLVKFMFDTFRPDIVINTAARVGGIGGNEAYHFDFAYDNLMINSNIIKNCVDFGVQKLLAFSSVCVFPHDLTLMEEEKMHDGEVFESNFAYGYSKRMVDVLIRAAEKQHGVKNWCSIIPGNIFGENDMFSIEHGHIIPSLIHKLYRAKYLGEEFKVWGDGKSLREFFYVGDLAKILIELIDMDYPNRLIVSGPKEYTISEIVDLLCEVADYNQVTYEKDKPNGQRSRPTSKKIFNSLFPNFEYSPIKESLSKTWNWFVENYPNVRTKY